jgi:hypothetical protein
VPVDSVGRCTAQFEEARHRQMTSALYNLMLREFDFLVSDFGFELVGQAARRADGTLFFRKGPISIHFAIGKGEVQVWFSVSLDFAKSHAVFRPFLSRIFTVEEIALWQNSQAFAAWQARPNAQDYITSTAEAAETLGMLARTMKQYCVDILNGDLTLLEDITRRR